MSDVVGPLFESETGRDGTAQVGICHIAPDFRWRRDKQNRVGMVLRQTPVEPPLQGAPRLARHRDIEEQGIWKRGRQARAPARARGHGRTRVPGFEHSPPSSCDIHQAVCLGIQTSPATGRRPETRLPRCREESVRRLATRDSYRHSIAASLRVAIYLIFCPSGPLYTIRVPGKSRFRASMPASVTRELRM